MAVVLVLADDERDIEKLALVDTVRVDRSDMRETERLRFSASYDAFLVCEGERWGMTGASDLAVAVSRVVGGAAWPGVVK